MKIQLPPLTDNLLELEHFPTAYQAFLFRASEFFTAETMAKTLCTTAENVRTSLAQMGLKETTDSDIWLKKGYITIIKQMWHILPYSQLIELLGFEEDEFAYILKEDDFLDIKLGPKPDCEKVVWRELTDEEKERTDAIKTIMEQIDTTGAEPFDFKYNVPKIEFDGDEKIKTRMFYCFSGLYRKAFEVDSRTYCPDNLLEAYQKIGINALWNQGLLSQLAPFPFSKEQNEDYKKRIAFMRDFTERCAKYGIKLFLYINEPRYMPESFFESNPDIKGHKISEREVCLCTSTEKVQNYLSDSIEYICREVPLIGGFVVISRSENITNCYSHSVEGTCNCPRCSQRSVPDVVSEVINCIHRGASRVSPDIKVLAWDWQWEEYNFDIIKKLNKDVILLAQSELRVPLNIGGVENKVIDYSISHIGPGEHALQEWNLAKSLGLKCATKIQVNTSWGTSTVPAVPIFPLIDEHVRRLKEEGIEHIIASWTLGGYPSHNIVQVAKHFYEKVKNPEVFELNEKVKKASEIFGSALQEFPFHVLTLYFGPQNAGPSTPLFLKPTGYQATMTCYSYDDTDAWRYNYPEDVYESQLDKLCTMYQKGLDILGDFSKDSDETTIMAHATYYLFKSTLDQFRFYIARRKGDYQEMIRCAQQEVVSAEKMLALMNISSVIGFEASNHYYFSKQSLCEKIVNCKYIINKLKSL